MEWMGGGGGGVLVTAGHPEGKINKCAGVKMKHVIEG